MTMMTDRVALVVGGARGIGLAIADWLAAEGARVFLTGRNDADVRTAAARIARRARGLVADAAHPDDIEKAVAEVVGHDRDAAVDRQFVTVQFAVVVDVGIGHDRPRCSMKGG